MNHALFLQLMNATADNSIVEILIDLLDTGDEADKCNAAKTLGKIRQSKARASLIARLRDEDIDVCVDAATALGQIGNPDDASALIQAAQGDPSGEVRIAAIEALGNMVGAEATNALARLAKTRPAGLEMLEDGDWDPWWDMQLKAIRSLGRIGSASAVPVLVGLLESEDVDDIESEIFNSLAMIGGDGESYLVARLSDAGPRQRRRIARALPLCKTPEAWKALLDSLKDGDADVRVAVVESLERFPDLQAFEGLLLVLVQDSDPRVRAVAVNPLARLEGKSSNGSEVDAALSRMLSDPEAAVRTAAVDGLRMRDAAEVGADLRSAVRDRLDDYAGAVAATACHLVRDWQDQQAVPALCRLALDPGRNTELRAAAIRALAGLSGTEHEFLNLLQQAAMDESDSVRLAALSALVQLDAAATPLSGEDDGDTRPLELLCRMVDPLLGEDEDTNLCFGAEDVAPADGNQTHEYAEPAAQNDHDSVDSGPSSTLDSIFRDNERIAGELGDEAGNDPLSKLSALEDEMHEYAEIVRKNVKERDGWKQKDKTLAPSDLRHLAARVLGDCDDESAVATLLVALADDDAHLRRDAADSLARIAGRKPDMEALANAWGALVTHLKTDERSVRLSCARALGALGKRKSMPALTEALGDEEPSVRCGAIEAQSRIAAGYRADHPKRKTAVRQIQERLRDPESSVRRTAAMALLDLGDDQGLRAGLDALIRSENSLGPAARLKMLVLRSNTVFAEQLVTILSGCSSSRERQPVLERIGEIYQVPEQVA